jgi:hypothetical protein
MTEDQLRESILVADCGNVTTRAALLDVVGGRYRFVASGQALSTGAPPTSDVVAGLVHAIADIEAVTGRQIVGEGGRLLIPSHSTASGADLFVATTSAAPPLRAVLVGLMDDISLASARRVALSTYTTIVDVIGLADTRSESDQVLQLAALRPDVFIITGGTDGGASDRVIRLTQVVALALSLIGPGFNPPQVIYAGNSSLRPVVAEILSGAQLRAAENIRPGVEIEYLDSAQTELEAIYEAGKLFTLPGAEELSDLSTGTLIPTAKGFGWTMQYLGEVLGNNVLGVDVGSATVTMASVINGQSQLMVRSDLGIGQNVSRLLDLVPLGRVARWLPGNVPPGVLRNLVANKAMFPQTVPMTAEELHVELALARELIRAMLPAAFPSRFDKAGMGLMPPVEMILASGAVLANAPRPGQAALVLLDALQPVGICSLALDTQGMAASLGAVARVQPMAAVQVVEAGIFRELGSVVVLSGHANAGEVVLQLKMVYENGSELEVEVEYGSLEVLPLPVGQSAELQLRPLKRFDIGAGPGRSWRRRVYGGAVGLIIDARGRPLRIPSDPAERANKVQQWLWDMGG